MNSYNGFSPEERLKGDKIIKEAIKNGILPELSTCSCKYCGQDKGILHYHCEDYSPDKILSDVIPVCWRCHMMIHTRFKHPLSYKLYFEEISKGIRYPAVFVGNDWNKLNIHYID